MDLNSAACQSDSREALLALQAEEASEARIEELDSRGEQIDLNRLMELSYFQAEEVFYRASAKDPSRDPYLCLKGSRIHRTEFYLHLRTWAYLVGVLVGVENPAKTKGPATGNPLAEWTLLDAVKAFAQPEVVFPQLVD